MRPIERNSDANNYPRYFSKELFFKIFKGLNAKIFINRRDPLHAAGLGTADSLDIVKFFLANVLSPALATYRKDVRVQEILHLDRLARELELAQIGIEKALLPWRETNRGGVVNDAAYSEQPVVTLRGG